MNKIVVTGSRGMIGSAVVDRLTGYENVAPVGLDLADGIDCTDPAQIVAAAGPDVLGIINLGAPGNIYEIAKNPTAAATTHVQTALAVVEAANDLDAVVVHVSSWEVLNHLWEPEPEHTYGAMKLAAEALAIARGIELGVPVASLRIGTAWGPTGRPDGVIERFIQRAVDGETLRVEGDPGRQFTHTDDLAAAFLLTVLDLDLGGELMWQRWTVVDPEMTSIANLAEWTVQMVGSGTCERVPPRDHDAPSIVIDSSPFAAVAQWWPDRPFVERLEEHIELRRLA